MNYNVKCIALSFARSHGNRAFMFHCFELIILVVDGYFLVLKT